MKKLSDSSDARSKAWNLTENIYKLKEKDKAAFYFPAEEWAAELETMRTSKSDDGDDDQR